jgi:hypothetical protein
MNEERDLKQDAPLAAELYREKAGPDAPAAPDTAKTVAGVMLLILGVGILAFLVRSLALDGSLWLLGERVPATVVSLWAEPLGEVKGGELSFQYFMTYRFTTPDGQAVTRSTRVSSGEWAGLGTAGRGSKGVDSYDNVELGAAAPVYQEQLHIPQETIGGLKEGGSVDVVYFPPFPSHNRLDESRFLPVMVCAYLPLAVVCGLSLALGIRLLRPAVAYARDQV